MKNEIESFEAIALPHLNSVYRAAYTLCSSRETAEDLMQATFLSALEHFHSFEQDTNCKAWLLTIMRNKWIDIIRHKTRTGQQIKLDENIAAVYVQKEIKYTDCDNLIANFSDEHVIKALKSLPEEQRFALFLSDVEQLSQQEIADIMKVAVGTIKSRTSRARVILKERLLSHAKELGFIGGEK